MNLLSQEEGKNLKPGDSVNVLWFGPRKKKDSTEELSRFFDGRQEYLEDVWKNKVVDSVPYLSVSDGYLVKLVGGSPLFCVNRMEKVNACEA